MHKSGYLSGAAAAAVGMGLATSSWAADEPTNRISEIIVTAQKTEQALQKVPLAITAMSGEELAQRHVRNIDDLQQQAPGLSLTKTAGSPQITVRGIGLQIADMSGEPGVAFNVDGVYLGRPTAASALMNDLERVEVLRGPQGTLYGRNAIGGVVNIVTRLPGSRPEYDASLTYGSHDNVELYSAVGGPLGGDGVLGRLSVYADRSDGSDRNEFTGQKRGDLQASGARVVVASKLSDEISLTVRADLYRDSSNGLIWSSLGQHSVVDPATGNFGITPSTPGGIFQAGLNLRPAMPVTPNADRYANDAPSYVKHDLGGVSATAEWSPKDLPFTVTSITAWRRHEFRRALDPDGSSAPIISETSDVEVGEQFSQELNVSGSVLNSGKWILGGYFYRENAHSADHYQFPALARVLERATELGQQLPPGALSGAIPANIDIILQNQETTSKAVYGQVSIPVAPRLSLTAGARYTADDKENVQSFYAFGGTSCENSRTRGNWDSFTWKAGLDFRPSDTQLFYASATTGFRAGGINLAKCNNPYDPEKLTAYEAGAKLKFLQGRAQLNISAFYYDYKDLQASIFVVGGIEIHNASNAKEYGGEVEGIVKLPAGFEASTHLSWLHATYGDFFQLDPGNPLAGVQNLHGNRLTFAPDWTVSAALSYRRQVSWGELFGRYEVHYTGRYFNDSFNSDYAATPEVTLHNLYVSLTHDQWELGAFGKNIFDKQYTGQRNLVQGTGSIIGQFAPGALWGVYLRVRY